MCLEAPLIFNVVAPTYQAQGFADEISRLESAGLWAVLDRSDPFAAFAGPADDQTPVILFACRKTRPGAP